MLRLSLSTPDYFTLQAVWASKRAEPKDVLTCRVLLVSVPWSLLHIQFFALFGCALKWFVKGGEGYWLLCILVLLLVVLSVLASLQGGSLVPFLSSLLRWFSLSLLLLPVLWFVANMASEARAAVLVAAIVLANVIMTLIATAVLSIVYSVSHVLICGTIVPIMLFRGL